MAIKLQYEIPISKVVKRAGMDGNMQNRAAALDAVGAKFVAHPSQIVIEWCGKTLANINYKPEVLEMLVKGTLGTAGKKVFLPSLESAIVLAHKTAIGNVKSIATEGEAKHEGTAGSTPEVLNQTPTKLADAVELYAPVRGTDDSSRYHTVAIGPDANCAVRFKDNKLSIRLEGPKLNQHTANLLGAGWKQSGEHYSMHLDTGNDDNLRKKSVGSLLFSTGIHFNKIGLDVLKLKGKGV